MPCNQCQHRGKKANPNGDGFPLALLVKRQFRHIHTNLSELSFRFDSIRHSYRRRCETPFPSYLGFSPKSGTRFPVLWSGARNVMTICRELHRSQRNLSRIFAKGKVSPRRARSFVSDSRAECLHFRQ
jgi:hypothetical protein